MRAERVTQADTKLINGWHHVTNARLQHRARFSTVHFTVERLPSRPGEGPGYARARTRTLCAARCDAR